MVLVYSIRTFFVSIISGEAHTSPIFMYEKWGRTILDGKVLHALNNFDLSFGEAVQLVDEGIDGAIGGFDVALEHFL
jgi:hypothetical protein